jgi:hypothetical protein
MAAHRHFAAAGKKPHYVVSERLASDEPGCRRSQVCGDTPHPINFQPDLVVDDARNVTAAFTSGK